MGVPVLKIFVCSPSDVGEERYIVKRAINHFKELYTNVVDIQGIFWEEELLISPQTFQKNITHPSQTDIFICILWTRIGFPLPQEFKRKDGSLYQSGTEYEFEAACGSYNDKKLPLPLMYRKTAIPYLSQKNQDKFNEKINQQKKLSLFFENQKDKLAIFFEKWFKGPDGTFTGSYFEFESVDKFEEYVYIHIEKAIDKRLADLNIPDEKKRKQTWLKGSPFRGLGVFDYEHAPIFFGRTKVINEIISSLRNQSENGMSFIMVTGVSGSGKSSLIRAGVLPVLIQPGVINEVGQWRRSIMCPSDLQGDLYENLASSFFKDTALRELIEENVDKDVLAENIRSNPTKIFDLLKSSFERASEKYQEKGNQKKPVRMILVVDQAEELFTLSTVSDNDRRAFMEAIQSLACSGHVWILFSMRNDFIHHCDKIKPFVELKKGEGLYTLMPPTNQEISQIIRKPAEIAGLSYGKKQDEKTGKDIKSLDVQLCEDMELSPDSLPLLEFTLEELYEQRDKEKGILKFEAYEQFNGIKGAMKTHADAIYQSLSSSGQSAFPAVMRMLICMNMNKDTPTRRTVRVEDVNMIPHANEVIKKFLEARLFVSDTQEDGQCVIRIIHDSLLTYWEKVYKLINDEKELFIIRDRVETEYKRWLEGEGNSDLLIPIGKRLGEARRLLREQSFYLTSELKTFIRESIKRARKIILLSLLIFLIACVTIAMFYLQERNATVKLTGQQNELGKEMDKLVNDGTSRVMIEILTAWQKDRISQGVLVLNEGKEKKAVKYLQDSRGPSYKIQDYLKQTTPENLWFSHMIIAEDYLKRKEYNNAHLYYQKSFDDIKTLTDVSGAEIRAYESWIKGRLYELTVLKKAG